MGQRETPFQGECMVVISQRGGLVWRQQVGLFRYPDSDQRIKVGVKGQADLGGIYRSIGIQIETKAPGQRDNTSKQRRIDQENWGKATERAGGVYAKVSSLEELHAVLDRIDGWFDTPAR